VSIDSPTNPPVLFSRPYLSAKELDNLSIVLHSGHAHGDGRFTASATEKLLSIIPSPAALLTSSGSHALEMASLLLELGAGDEVILPSFTFSSAANAIALSGARIVFVDIDPTTGNVDPEKVARHITPRTRAISVMHYGGVGVDLDSILSFGLPVIEDNAHGLGATYRGKELGTFGALAIQSFHDTKNIHSGEGGAILMNDDSMVARAEMIREKGTDRSRFLRGQVDKYTWADIGSSYLPSELNAAVLDSQLDEFASIQMLRHRVWDAYARELPPWAEQNGVDLMSVPGDRAHPAHVFYMLMHSHSEQSRVIAHLRSLGIVAVFHYVPLDSSPAGLRYGSAPEPCVVSADFSSRLVRLPLWAGMSDMDIERVIAGVQCYRAKL